MKCYYCETEPINSTTNTDLKVCCCYRLHKFNGKETQYYSNYQDEIDHLRAQVNQQKAEIEYWKKNAFNGCMEKARIYKKAYKEFAEKLKEIGKQEGAYDYVSLWDIDKLLKDMTGED